MVLFWNEGQENKANKKAPQPPPPAPVYNAGSPPTLCAHMSHLPRDPPPQALSHTRCGKYWVGLRWSRIPVTCI
eukprot:m.345284 g.345284  ORF g.345284 m.345284 type:complete len:74 (-) comp20661_c0_seq9:678-899(-)